MSPAILLFLAVASLIAGFLDAIVGGGGLITIPALMIGFPTAGLPGGVPLPTILGINKVSSCTGTTLAAAKFLRAGTLPWREMVWPVIAAMIGACGGVALAYQVKGDFLRPVMLGLMIVMLLFTVLKPDLGKLHAPKYGQTHQRGLAAAISLALGFYDGFFGPGTGSLLIFLYVAVLGFDFLRSSALAKSVNWASNIAATVLFLWQGSWIPQAALAMAVGNGIGGWLGAHVALKKGSGWVRGVFIAVVGLLILRLGWQMLQG
jgi:uncharacterized membrane protein YfcA